MGNEHQGSEPERPLPSSAEARVSDESGKWRSFSHRESLRIALVYAFAAGLWIIASDALVHLVVPDVATAELFSVIKGWAFVSITALMLFGLIQRLLYRIGKSEAALRSSEAQVRAIFDGVVDAIFIHDKRSGDIIDVNLSACRMFGYDRADFRGLRVEDVSSGVEPYTRRGALELIGRIGEEKEVMAEWQARRKDGSLFWAEISGRIGVVGEEERLLVTVRDISKRKDVAELVRKLSRAVDQSPVSIIITDTEGCIEYVNPATCRLTGYGADELLGKTPRLFKSGHTGAGDYRRLWEAIREGGEWRGEFLNRRKNGETYWEAASISAITDESGKATHFLGVKEDITARKNAEEKLMRQEALLEEAGEIAHVGGWEFDPATSIGSWSSEVARIHDLEPDVAATAEFGLGFFHGESRERIEAAVAAAVRDGTPYDLELELISAKGRRKWVRTIGRPITEEGRVIRVRGSIQDITERKEAERALRESEAHYRSLFGNMLNGFAYCRMEYDEDGRPVDFTYIEVNEAFRKLTGFPDVVGKKANDLFPGIHQSDPQMLETFEKIIRSGSPYRFETHVAALNMWFAVSVYSPEPKHFVTIFDVITDRKLAEQELRKSRESLRALLARLQETREQERTRISREIHDVLGQLLTGMKMDLSWLERRLAGIADAGLRESFQKKISATNSLTDLMLESVQKISRDLRPSLLDNLGLAAALQSEARQFAERTGIACEIAAMPAAVRVSADCATNVFRIFQEILTNVARHSLASHVRIAMEQTAAALTLKVEDDGRGISSAASRDPASLGLLGMTERAAMHGGHIEIKGDEGRGTCVTLTIPSENP